MENFKSELLFHQNKIEKQIKDEGTCSMYGFMEIVNEELFEIDTSEANKIIIKMLNKYKEDLDVKVFENEFDLVEYLLENDEIEDNSVEALENGDMDARDYVDENKYNWGDFTQIGSVIVLDNDGF